MAFINWYFRRLLQYIQHSPGNSRRGFGIDCAILSCQVSVRIVLVFVALSNMYAIVRCYVIICNFAGVHQSNPGGLSSGRCSGSCWKRPCHSHGGLWGLPPWILHRLLPGHLPNSKQPVRKPALLCCH